jgi:hypothetical protein
MNARVQEAEHPDRRTHIPNTRPHAHHRTRMMIRLQRRAPFSLSQNDERIKHLVELAEVKPPAPERQSFIPQPSHIAAIRVPGREELHGLALRLPQSRVRAESDELPVPSRSMHLAKRIRRSSKRILRPQAGPVLAQQMMFPPRPSMRQRPQHAKERKRREDRQKHIMQNHKRLERSRLGEGIRLVLAIAVYAVPDYGSGGVEGGDGNGDFVVERAVVDVGGDAKGRGEGAGVCWWGEGERLRVWWKLEEPAGWDAEVDRGGRCRCCHCCVRPWARAAV